jgi:hypothetical protein
MSRIQGHDGGERVVRRLVRCYPKEWRARYGEEFTELLNEASADGELSSARKLDVLVHGAWTRLAYAGLAGSALNSHRRVRSTLVAVLVVPAIFAMLAVGVWAQLTVGWQWSASVRGGTTAAMWLMSGGLLGLGVLAVCVIALVAVLSVSAARTGGGVCWWPVTVSLAAGAVLYVGCHHFGPHWPGTGGHDLAGPGLVPSWMAPLGWAGTLWISSYWAHPVALVSFPAGELAWMVISPVAWFGLIVSGAAIVRRLELTPRLQRLTALLCVAAATGMVVFLAGAVLWVCSADSGAQDLSAVGAIDFVIVALLGAALVAMTHILRRLAPDALTPVTD